MPIAILETSSQLILYETLPASICKFVDLCADFLIRLFSVHSTEQTPFKWEFPPGTHFTAESIDEMRIKCLDQGYNIVIQPRFELLI